MELALVIWVITSLNSISGFLFFISCILGTIAGFNAVNIIFTDNTTATDKSYRKNSWRFGIAAAITFSLYTIVPTTKTGWMMAGGYVAQTAIKSDTAKKFALVIENKMQEVLDEATEQAKIKAKSINKETEKKD